MEVAIGVGEVAGAGVRCRMGPGGVAAAAGRVVGGLWGRGGASARPAAPVVAV